MIRFNNPSTGTKSDFHRICIDPKGVSNQANPHIPVSAGTVAAAQRMQTCLRVTGKALFVISLVTSGVRIVKSIYDEITIDEEIEALLQIVSGLEEDLNGNALSGSERSDTEDALEFAKQLLSKARHNKSHAGEKTLLTVVCIGGEFGGAALGGLAGAQAGAMAGACAGPVGAVAGAVIGSVLGAVVGGEGGGSAVQNFECTEEGVSTELHGSLLNWGTDVRSEVLSLDGNASLGRTGLRLGAGAALFEAEENDDVNVSVLKADAKCNVTNQGVDVGVEGKMFRAEADLKHVTIGGGLNFDTGFKIASDGVKLEALGFGFSCGEQGVGVKVPFFDVLFK